MTGSPNGGAGYAGHQDASTGGPYNAQAFLVRAILAQLSTATLVQVKAVTNNGGVSPVGFVDLLPLVNQIDGAGNAVPHAVVHHCPYFRLQGGANAVIIDPAPGDIGIAVFADRDISSATVNKGQANPGSRRRFSMADGLYIGGVLNGAPTQYVQFSTDGIAMVSPTKIHLQAPDIVLDAQTVEINATTSMAVTTKTLSIDASTSATVTTPTFTVNGSTVLNGDTQINGALAQGAGGSSSNASLIGPLTVQHEVTANGSHTVSAHTHLDPQGGNTGTPTG